MKDYDLKISYHTGRINVVTDSLSKKSTTNLANNLTTQEQLRRDFEKLELEVVSEINGRLMAAIVVQWSLLDEIKVKQMEDPYFRNIIEELLEGMRSEFYF